MKWFLALPLLLAACEQPPGPSFNAKPPVAYQGDAQFTVVTTSAGTIQRICNDPNARFCAVNNTVFTTNPCNWTDPYANAMCHEKGHINGWPSNHPVK